MCFCVFAFCFYIYECCIFLTGMFALLPIRYFLTKFIKTCFLSKTVTNITNHHKVLIPPFLMYLGTVMHILPKSALLIYVSLVDTHEVCL